MNSFILKTSSSYGAVAMLQTLVRSGLRFKKLELDVKSHVTDSENPEDWPVKFTCESDDPENQQCLVFIQMLTCGYAGKGPYDLFNVLKLTGFDDFLSEDEIYTKKHISAMYEKF